MSETDPEADIPTARPSEPRTTISLDMPPAAERAAKWAAAQLPALTPQVPTLPREPELPPLQAYGHSPVTAVRPSDEDLAEQMFRAYNAQGPNPGKTWDGKDVPPFSECGQQVQGKWLAAARLARALLLGCVCCLALVPALAHADDLIQRSHIPPGQTIINAPACPERIADVDGDCTAPSRGLRPVVIPVGWTPVPEALTAELLAADGPLLTTPWWMQLVMLIGGSGAVLTMLVVLAHKGVAALRSWLQSTPKLVGHEDVRAAGVSAANFLDVVVAGLEAVERPLVSGPLDAAGRKKMADAALGALKAAAKSDGLPLAQQILDLGDHWAYGQIASAVERLNAKRDAQVDLPSTPAEELPNGSHLPSELVAAFHALPVPDQRHLLETAAQFPAEQRASFIQGSLVLRKPFQAQQYAPPVPT